MVWHLVVSGGPPRFHASGPFALRKDGAYRGDTIDLSRDGDIVQVSEKSEIASDGVENVQCRIHALVIIYSNSIFNISTDID